MMEDGGPSYILRWMRHAAYQDVVFGGHLRQTNCFNLAQRHFCYLTLLQSCMQITCDGQGT